MVLILNRGAREAAQRQVPDEDLKERPNTLLQRERRSLSSAQEGLQGSPGQGADIGRSEGSGCREVRRSSHDWASDLALRRVKLQQLDDETANVEPGGPAQRRSNQQREVLCHHIWHSRYWLEVA